MPKLVINSKSSGDYKIENRGGRSFIVTQMLPIQVDSVMNGLLYPASTVLQSYNQLDKLPAPAGHPLFDGKSVSAFDPEGGAAFNVGAFVREPKIEGRNVLTDLVVDIDVANRSVHGKEIVERIMSGKRMGVSTGLKGKVKAESGIMNDQQYQGIVNEITFDHVAILLSEPPAGEATYTLNSSDFFKQQKKETKVMRQVVINTEDLSLVQHKAIEAAASNPETVINALNHMVTVDEAEEILTNAGKCVFNGEKHQLDDFIANKSDFSAFKAKQGEARKESVDFVIANSKMTVEQLEVLDSDSLKALVNSIVPAHKHIVNGGVEDTKLTALEDA